MNFDFKQFCRRYKIETVESGKNVARGNININCPFCKDQGNPDPSFHLGVDPAKQMYACWRNTSHSGRRLHRLLIRLSGLSYPQVCDLLGQVYLGPVDATDWSKISKNPLNSTIFKGFSVENESKSLRFPKNIRKFSGLGAEKRFLSYLNNRDLPEYVTDLYGLRYSIAGNFKDRVIFPIKQDYSLVTWTGRSIFKDCDLRYLSLSTDDEAVLSIKQCIWQVDDLLDSGGKGLFVTEGPFDGLKMDFYGRNLGYRATCLFGLRFTDTQLSKFIELSECFNTIYVLLDPEQMSFSLKLKDQLNEFIGNNEKVRCLYLEESDPGALLPNQVIDLCKSLN